MIKTWKNGRRPLWDWVYPDVWVGMMIVLGIVVYLLFGWSPM